MSTIRLVVYVHIRLVCLLLFLCVCVSLMGASTTR